MRTRTLPVGDVEGSTMAWALRQLAAALRAAIEDGARRGVRSVEYETRLEVILGGETYGRGLLARLGDAPPVLPAWAPLPPAPPAPPDPPGEPAAPCPTATATAGRTSACGTPPPSPSVE